MFPAAVSVQHGIIVTDQRRHRPFSPLARIAPARASTKPHRRDQQLSSRAACPSTPPTSLAARLSPPPRGVLRRRAPRACPSLCGVPRPRAIRRGAMGGPRCTVSRIAPPPAPPPCTCVDVASNFVLAPPAGVLGSFPPRAVDAYFCASAPVLLPSLATYPSGSCRLHFTGAVTVPVIIAQ